jgi:hypothetical protein
MAGRTGILVFIAAGPKSCDGLVFGFGLLVWFAFGIFLHPAFSQASPAQTSKHEPAIGELQKQLEEMRRTWPRCRIELQRWRRPEGSQRRAPVLIQSRSRARVPRHKPSVTSARRGEQPRRTVVISLQRTFFDSRRFSGRNNTHSYSQ